MKLAGFLLVSLMFPGAAALANTEALPHGITEKHVMVPMRDGVKLSVFLYFPLGDGPWPVLLEQRYANARGTATRRQFAGLASHGYVVALQNFRGTQQSEGTYVGYRALGWGELQDGYDTVEWLAGQSWSNGKVGTFGSSQAGYAQNFLAVTQPPHLVCQYMIDTGLSLFHEGYRIGGTTRPERFKGMDAACREPAHNRALMKEWLDHPTYDEYWAAEDCTRHFQKMNVPCFTIGSWYDFMCVGSIESYIGRQHRGGPASRGQQKLLLGPWLHGRFNKGDRVGQLQYPENAGVDVVASMLRWFDHHLRGEANGADRQARLQYYVMGAVGEPDAPGNEWREADDWPVPSVSSSYYLRTGGVLTTRPPTAPTSGTTLRADPLHPAAIPGRSFPGARDARAVEKQPDVLTFTSAELTRPVEWTGKVRAELYVSSSARDTDFIVRVTDVYPDGRSILIVDSIRRARYREGFDREVLMETGTVYRVAFDVGWLSQIFNRGHRIRITVASTGAPFYEPNPNTGAALTMVFPDNTVVAENRVHHEHDHASRVIAPVIRQRPKYQIGYSQFRADLPGGMHPYFTSLRACVVDGDGTGRRVLAGDLTRRQHSWTQFAGWSPDGDLAIIGSGWESPENAAWEEEQRTFRMTEGWLYDMCLLDMTTQRLTNVTAPERASIYNTGLFFWPDNPGKLGFQALVGPTSHPFSMDLDGRNKRDLTAGKSAFTYGFCASPDGEKIAYHKAYRVFIASADGSEATPVDSGNPFNFCPSWSRDGQWLLFLSGEHYDCHPHVVRRDGTGLRKVADRRGYRGVVECIDRPSFHSASSDVPVWSSDGEWIFFTAGFGDRVELMRVSLRGAEERLTRSDPGVLNYHPAVSPGGRWVVFGSTRSGTRQLHVARVDGSGEYQLTRVRPGGGAMWPHWRPSPRCRNGPSGPVGR